jgi:hypothetical protein
MRIILLPVLLSLSACIVPPPAPPVSSTTDRVRRDVQEARESAVEANTALDAAKTCPDVAVAASKGSKLEIEDGAAHGALSQSTGDSTFVLNILHELDPLTIRLKLNVAGKYLALSCLDDADTAYRDVVKTFVGANFAAARQEALIGIDDVRAARTRVQTYKICLRLADCLIQESQQEEAGDGSGSLLAYGRTVCADCAAFAA